MKSHDHSLELGIAIMVMIVGSTGCAGNLTQADDEEDIGTAEGALITQNALTPNALTPNALTPNALTPNALTPNALTPNALTPNAMNPIKDPGSAGLVSRELLKYTVGCALSTTQSFSFSWTDSSNGVHNETYMGLLGLAPAWATGPLNLAGQRIVSACLGARTNYYGTSVTFSARSSIEPLKSALSPEELHDYNRVEGAFWGNVFSATPYLNSCYRHATVNHSRAQLRECAAGHLANDTIVECGIIHIVGPCGAPCSALDASTRNYPSCIDHAEIPGSTATTPYVITSLLE